MANPSIVIRVAANIAELRKNLAEGGQAINITTAGMAKLAASLDGEKLSQRAHNIVAAVDKIGGVTKLTEREKARLNRTLTATIEKYQVMGKEAPAAMVALAEATKTAEKPTTALSVAVGVLVAELVQKAAKAAMDFGKEALLTSAKVESLGGVARFMGQQAGFAGDEIDALVQALRRQGITSEAANNAVIQMVRANLSLADATKLATVAQSLARATGENSSATLTKLIQGTQTLQVEVLRNAGVVIQLDQEYKKFAATNDRTVQSLSAQEKQQIALAAVLREGERVAGVYGVTNEFVGGKIQSMTRHQEEAAKSIGDVFKPALVVAVDILTEFLKIVQKAPELFGALGVAAIGMAGAFTTIKGAAALGVISTTAMTTALGLLWPAVAIGATAFSAWKIGRWIGEFTTLTDVVERLAGRMMGLSKADIEGGMAARKFVESAEGKAAVLAAQAKALSDLEAKARAADKAAQELALADAQAAEAAKKHAEERKKLAEAFEANERAYAALMSQIKNEKGMAQFEADAATMERAAENLNQLWMMERDAHQVALDAKAKARAADIAAEAEWQATMGSGIVIIGQVAEAFAGVEAVAVQSATRVEQTWASAMGAVTAGLGAMTGQVQAAMTMSQLQKRAAEVGGVVHLDDYKNAYVHVPGVNAPGEPAPRAMGGPVSAGQPYTVGERGPELFVPRQSGTIVPNGGGGVTLAPVLHFHGPVIGSSMEFEQTVAGALLNLLKSGAVQMPA